MTIHTGGKKAVEVRYNDAEVAEGWYADDLVYRKEPDNREFMSFTLNITAENLTWRIPTVAPASNLTNTYDWDVAWGDGTRSRVTGTSVYNSAAGVSHTYAQPGEYTVMVRPHDPESTKWLAAYGPSDSFNCYSESLRNTVTAIDGNITWRATRSSLNDVPNYEFGYWFSRFNNLASMGRFNLPQDLTTVGSYFCRSLFLYCYHPGFTMNSVFQLPQGITTTGTDFCYRMFYGCYGSAFTMNSVFQLPQGITTVGTGFCADMFYTCRGSAFTMNSIFQLPQGITSVGTQFCHYMFYGCYGAAFNMNSVFQLPQGITSVGTQFCFGMFYSCYGDAFTMNSIFQLPQGITSVGTQFCYRMFCGCSGSAFTMNSVFQLPQGITTVGIYFCYNMFYTCRGLTGHIARIFGSKVLPDTEVNKSDVFSQMFYNAASLTDDISAIPQLVQVSPSSAKQAFTNTSVVRGSISANW